MSTLTYAVLFYGFPLKIRSWDLEDHISAAGLNRKVRAVSFGPLDNYSEALAIRESYVQVNIDSRTLLKPVPKKYDAKLEAEWSGRLRAAAATLGVTFKTPHWYFAPWQV